MTTKTTKTVTMTIMIIMPITTKKTMTATTTTAQTTTTNTTTIIMTIFITRTITRTNLRVQGSFTLMQCFLKKWQQCQRRQQRQQQQQEWQQKEKKWLIREPGCSNLSEWLVAAQVKKKFHLGQQLFVNIFPSNLSNKSFKISPSGRTAVCQFTAIYTWINHVCIIDVLIFLVVYCTRCIYILHNWMVLFWLQSFSNI